MKYIHSFWSKPLFDMKNKDNRIFRHNGGFPSAFLFYCSWTYSCLTIKKYYPNLHLVTDSKGIELFKNVLQLPYVTFSDALDDLNDYHKGAWALGKLYTYRQQQEPFCHIDGDVFFFGPILKELENKNLFCQSFDHNGIQYSEMHPYVHKHFRNVPKAFEGDLSATIKYFNVGIIGGSDIDLFQEYTAAAFKLIDQNQDKLDAINVTLFNLYYEQFLLSNIIAKHKKEVACLFPEPDRECTHNFAAFHEIPNGSNYIHLISHFKRSTEFLEQMAMRLQFEYPDYYKRLLKFQETHLV